MTRPAVLLTGVGKRYDIVTAFSQHATVIAADMSPLAPAQYAADHRVTPPRADAPEYIPFLQQLVDEHGVKAVIPLTDLDLEVLARSELPAFVPEADVCKATFDKYLAHQLPQERDVLGRVRARRGDAVVGGVLRGRQRAHVGRDHGRVLREGGDDVVALADAGQQDGGAAHV